MQPLRGLTVVSLEQAIAAPYATRQLADLGARVIKVERPVAGDFARGYDHRVDGLSSHFVWVNRNKESLTLDVKDPRGREAASAARDRRRVRAEPRARRDGPDGARRGPSCRPRDPRLIVCDISGYGHGGPYGIRCQRPTTSWCRVLAVRLVMLLIEAHQIVEREAVVRGNEIDARRRATAGVLIEIAAARLGDGPAQLTWPSSPRQNCAPCRDIFRSTRPRAPGNCRPDSRLRPHPMARRSVSPAKITGSWWMMSRRLDRRLNLMQPRARSPPGRSETRRRASRVIQ